MITPLLLTLHGERDWRLASFHFYLAQKLEGERTAIAMPLVMNVVEPGDLVTSPTFTLSINQAQQFMDELWSLGLRPTEGSGSAGSLAATERHLADVRALLFAKEGVGLPG